MRLYGGKPYEMIQRKRLIQFSDGSTATLGTGYAELPPAYNWTITFHSLTPYLVKQVRYGPDLCGLFVWFQVNFVLQFFVLMQSGSKNIPMLTCWVELIFDLCRYFLFQTLPDGKV